MNIPQEIIDHISTYIPDRNHQVDVCLVNKAWNLSMTPILYRDIDIWEGTLGSVEFRETGELPQISGLIRALAKNTYLSSLVHSIRHSFYVDPSTEATQRQKWEMALMPIRLNLQEIIDRNGFPRVTRLTMYFPDIEIADILLKGLLSQLQSLRINSPFFKHLAFDTEEGPGPENLGELELEFSQDVWRKTGDNGLFNEKMGFMVAYNRINERMSECMNSRLNNFFSYCPSLHTLRINGTKDLCSLLDSVTFPTLKALEIGSIFNHDIDLAIESLNNFLDRHPDLSRLALKNIPNGNSQNVRLSEALCLNIREFISSIEEVPEDYYVFLRRFQGLHTYRLQHHMIVGEVLHSELLNLLPELQANSPGIRNLTLPMPTHIAGWTLTNQKQEMARDALMEFGKALTEFIPTVEKFGIGQTGRFSLLEAADWADSFSSHPSLQSLAIKKSFLPNISMYEPDGVRQGFINELALKFAVIPRLESFVFFERIMDEQAVKVDIIRMEDGSVEGRETLVGLGDVDKVFSDDFFDSGGW